MNAKQETNRSEEQVLLESIESEVEFQTWDRVAKLIDIKEFVDAEKKEKEDTSRMYKLFIQLKVCIVCIVWFSVYSVV